MSWGSWLKAPETRARRANGGVENPKVENLAKCGNFVKVDLYRVKLGMWTRRSDGVGEPM